MSPSQIPNSEKNLVIALLERQNLSDILVSSISNPTDYYNLNIQVKMEVKGLNFQVTGQKSTLSSAIPVARNVVLEETKAPQPAKSALESKTIKKTINVPTIPKSQPKPQKAKVVAQKIQPKVSNSKSLVRKTKARDTKPRSIACDIIDLTQRHFEVLRGPILLTAPHGIQIYRGQQCPDDRTRLHERERYTTQIAIRCAKEFEKTLGGGSFCVWNEQVAKQKDMTNLDPNYLLEHQFHGNAWNQCLGKFQQKMNFSGDLPILHVDMHGKMKRKNGRIVLDLGVQPMYEIVEDEEFVDKVLDAFTEEMTEVMEWINPTRRVPFEVEPDPNLHGFWGHDTNTTISHQSVLKDIPAIQFEMPPEMRAELVQNEEFLKRFSQAIVNAYCKIYGIKSRKLETLRSKIQQISPQHPGLLPGYDEYLEFVATVDKKITVF